MEAVQIVVGLGGTGAKVIQSLVHLAAAGLVDGELDCVFVDQDGTNGNTTQAEASATRYKSLVKTLRAGSLQPETRPETAALRTPLSLGQNIYQPIDAMGATLQTAFAVAETPRKGDPGFDDAWLMRALFTQAERTVSMDNGFRARPAVGSAAYLRDAQLEGALWSRLSGSIKRCKRVGRRVNIVLVGSIFGGTGASGLPTLCEALRHFLDEEDKDRQQLRLGGVVMLPYFESRPSDTQAGYVYGPADPGQVHFALDHYKVLFQENWNNRLVDALYLIGLHEKCEVPYDPVGGGDGQRNPVLLPELLGALAVAHFCRNRDIGTGRVFYALHGRPDEVKVADLPMPGAGEGRHLDRDRLFSLLRCAFVFVHALAPLLDEIRAGREDIRDFPYLVNHLPRGLSEDERKLLGDLGDYLTELLQWAAALELWMPRGMNYDPLTAARFADPARKHAIGAKLRFAKNRSDAASPDLKADDLAVVKAAFDQLGTKERLASLQQIIERLADPAVPPRAGRGAGSKPLRSVERLFDALYRAAEIPLHQTEV
ncbi:MAG: hypothetical protein Kilf2KO_20480 [Rhodospirillales bacterium]